MTDFAARLDDVNAKHILILAPGVDVIYCGRCYGAWGTESAADATPCEVTQ